MNEPVNIREIARELSCSPSTVSRVLSGRESSIKISEKTRRRILDYCGKIGYQPSIHAARFFSGQSRTIGFLAGSEMIDDENLARSLFAVCRELFKAGYRCLPLLNDRRFIDTKEYLNIFRRNEIDALIVWGANEDCTCLEELSEAGLPFLLLTNRLNGYPSVTVEQKGPVALLTRRCRELGARRLAGLFCENGDSHQQRRAGFLAGAEGAEYRIFSSNLTREEIPAIAPEVLEWRPDAIICGNDYAAIAIERCLLERGLRIPEDVLLTGGDNIAASLDCIVPLSTFDQRAEACAVNCVKILLDRLQNQTPLRSMELFSEPLWRESTARTGIPSGNLAQTNAAKKGIR